MSCSWASCADPTAHTSQESVSYDTLGRLLGAADGSGLCEITQTHTPHPGRSKFARPDVCAICHYVFVSYVRLLQMKQLGRLKKWFNILTKAGCCPYAFSAWGAGRRVSDRPESTSHSARQSNETFCLTLRKAFAKRVGHSRTRWTQKPSFRSPRVAAPTGAKSFMTDHRCCRVNWRIVSFARELRLKKSTSRNFRSG